VPEPDPSFRPITALPEIRIALEAAPDVLKQDISRIKKLLADPDALLPPPIVAFTLEEAKGALELLGQQAKQLRRWQQDDISDTEQAELTRLLGLVPEIRPLIQRLIALATELDKRARTGSRSPRKMWRH
jgi:hypothetical protein